ncbi:MAG: hypothetical protein ACP5KJ_03685 [Candidatus Micrarchaeia archaeon]
MLSASKIEQIKQILSQRPHSVAEIANSLGVSWKTADKYLDELCKTDGAISTHVFKNGLRGGLKIAFLNASAKDSGKLMKFLRRRIMNAREKTDFSPFEIYQYVDEKMKKAFWEAEETAFLEHGSEDINNLLLITRERYLSFSGDFSWIQHRQGGKHVLKTIQMLAEKGIRIQMLGRIDMKSIKGVEQLFSINERLGMDAIDIRHIEQPLRGAIVDDQQVRLVEALKSLEKTIYYEIRDPVWIKFVKDIFFEFYAVSVPAMKRAEELRKLF